jgi:flavin-binding protein dodecin
MREELRLEVCPAASLSPFRSSSAAADWPQLEATACGRLGQGDLENRRVQVSVVKIIEVVGRSTTSSDDAVKSALSEASRSLRNIKALDVVSVGLRGDNLDEWGALVRISFLVENVTD